MNDKSTLDMLIENMGNVLRGNGKLNVVFVSIVVILIGIVLYLCYNESRLKKLEEKLKQKS